MSSPFRKAGKVKSSPIKREDVIKDLQRIHNKLTELQIGLMQVNNFSNETISGLYCLLKFLGKKNIIDDNEYKEFLKEQNDKAKIIAEINNNKELTYEQKIEKAKENNIEEEFIIKEK